MDEDRCISKDVFKNYFKGINDITLIEYSYFLNKIKKEPK